MHMSVTVRKSPGMRMIHHDFVISALSAFESMLPHEICSSGRPIPMKLKVDSAMIALLIFMTTINMIDEAKFGVRCFHKTCRKLPPIHLAAMTYPLFRICFTSVRTTLAILGQLVIPIINEILKMLAFPKIACNKMTSSRFGMLKKISVKRMSSESTHSGAHPLTEPKTIASTVERNVASTPIKSEIRPPYQIMEKISLPIVSVPKRNSPQIGRAHV